jgi:DNA-binding NarL/FixJ family response regulator
MLGLSRSFSTEPIKIEKLTDRETGVIESFLDPNATRMVVAAQLAISENTLNQHLRSIFSKFCVMDIRGAVLVFYFSYPELAAEALRQRYNQWQLSS